MPIGDQNSDFHLNATSSSSFQSSSSPSRQISDSNFAGASLPVEQFKKLENKSLLTELDQSYSSLVKEYTEMIERTKEENEERNVCAQCFFC